jgi:hypothetical protein
MSRGVCLSSASDLVWWETDIFSAAQASHLFEISPHSSAELLQIAFCMALPYVEFDLGETPRNPQVHR